MQYTRISWEKLIIDVISLSKKVQEEKTDEIIAISRGGVVIGRLLSDYLSLPMSNVSMESYRGVDQIKEPVITQTLTKNYTNKVLLLVDDVSDSGKTFVKGKEYLQSLGVKKVISVSPYIKSHTIYIPNFWIENIDTWIIFPYEIHEMQTLFEKELGDAKKAREKLLELGIEEWEIGK